ncbi:zinc dependent phospholipase C family protein [Cohnella nanjingensis]|uniref:Zinc dependent phospholipase C family protein n=1 Tax=Cohnella nanjingensis TaxID=1387779 RepID=A0A7X0RVH8_9BACL|nr:zinc dependent phospholipase C family protein [Cohnella nanjingensis]MBB6672874.1 zinc dependent phospholipase C family protein [Cohnella nanjingensis]
MPNIWAHIQFGREIAADTPWQTCLADRTWLTAYQLGCQGPDFLFYDNYLPWRPETPANRLGSLLHNLHCGPFLLDLFAAARGRPLADPAVAFVIGFLQHHILDRHMHPYVFSLSGFKRWNHQRFETAMDSAILLRRAGIATGTTPVAPEIDTGGRLPGGFADTFGRLVAKHYPGLAGAIAPAALNRAVAQFVQAQRLFFDPRGWKGKLLFGRIAPFSPPRRPPDWDVLNERRTAWIDPTDRTCRRAESAMDLWERALADGARTTAAGFAWLTSSDEGADGALREAFAALLGNLSYETGLPCGSAWITYAEPVI